MAAMLDTCAVIDFPDLQHKLPEGLGLSAVVIAELALGVVAVPSGAQRDERRKRLDWARTFFDPYPFDSDAALAYGRLAAAVQRAGRTSGARVADLMIASTAAASEQPLHTRNADDFVGLDGPVEIIVV